MGQAYTEKEPVPRGTAAKRSAGRAYAVDLLAPVETPHTFCVYYYYTFF